MRSIAMPSSRCWVGFSNTRRGSLPRRGTRGPLRASTRCTQRWSRLSTAGAIRGELTDDSAQEQAGAGLDRCSPEEFARLQALNAAYNAKFGFPFIVAVKGLDRVVITQQFAPRLEHDPATEFREALAQVAKIARLRLIALIEP